MTENATPIAPGELSPILNLAAKFAHADPVAWSDDVPRSTLSIMLRHAGNQFPYVINPCGKLGRTQIMYNDLPMQLLGMKHVPPFDFAARFRDLTGTDVTDFINVGLVAYAAARSGNQLGFARTYFKRAREVGLAVADDDTVQAVLRNFAADSSEHARRSSKLQQQCRDYAAYDFNSLMVFPLIRPWPLEIGARMEFDRMIAPLPDLLLYRLTSGVYYDMHMRWRDSFDEYFGHLLTLYVGRLLRNCVPDGHVISEDEIRQTYPTSAGKIPDFVLLEGKTAVLVEVKIARIHRIVYATGREDKLEESLRAIRDGLIQVFEFRSAAAGKMKGLERLARCKEFIPVVVTLEPTYLSGSVPFKEFLRADLPAAMHDIDWTILSLDDLEWAQVHLSGGVLDVPSFFRHALTAHYNTVLDNAARLSGRRYGDSMLFKKEGELYDRLGVPRSQSGS